MNQQAQLLTFMINAQPSVEWCKRILKMLRSKPRSEMRYHCLITPPGFIEYIKNLYAPFDPLPEKEEAQWNYILDLIEKSK